MGTIFTDVCKHSPCKINHRAICWPRKQKPKQAVLCQGCYVLCLFSLVLLCLVVVSRSPGLGQCVRGSVCVLQADASILWPQGVAKDVGMRRGLRGTGDSGGETTFSNFLPCELSSNGFKIAWCTWSS